LGISTGFDVDAEVAKEVDNDHLAFFPRAGKLRVRSRVRRMSNRIGWIAFKRKERMEMESRVERWYC